MLEITFEWRANGQNSVLLPIEKLDVKNDVKNNVKNDVKNGVKNQSENWMKNKNHEHTFLTYSPLLKRDL